MCLFCWVNIQLAVIQRLMGTGNIPNCLYMLYFQGYLRDTSEIYVSTTNLSFGYGLLLCCSTINLIFIGRDLCNALCRYTPQQTVHVVPM